MTTKERLLQLFESNKGNYLSGEEIAEQLCVSRTAVWKAVNSLRDQGYAIDAVTNKGYCLSAKTDILSPQGIQKYLEPEWGKLDISVLLTVDSTNALVREKANSGLAEGYTVIANEQTAGRGRYGRKFFSPYGTGVYLSMLLRPFHYSASQAVRITTMAAVAMCEAIEETTGEKAWIKWVNDIYVRGKKVCGILTEASFGLESGLLEYAVLGLGLNVYPPQKGFPKELDGIAGPILESAQDDMKNRLAAAFLNRFMRYYKAQNQTEYIEKYRSYCFVIGKRISVISGRQTRSAYACGIDDGCRLQVRYDDGEMESLSYGEITMKLTKGDLL